MPTRATTPRRSSSTGNRRSSGCKQSSTRIPWLSPAIVLAITVIIFRLLSEKFATPTDLGVIAQQTAVVGTLAIGQTLIILTAGIDLSCGAIMVFSSMVMAKTAFDQGVPGFAALILGLVVGGLAGAVQRPADHAGQTATVHRHPRLAGHLHLADPSLCHGPNGSRHGVGQPVEVARPLDRTRQFPSHQRGDPHARAVRRAGLRVAIHGLGNTRVRGRRRSRRRAACRHSEQPGASSASTWLRA